MKSLYLIFNSKGKATRGVKVKNKVRALLLAKKYNGKKGTLKFVKRSEGY